MKNIFRTTLVVIALLFSANSFAQKFGHINSEELLKAMPETDSAQVKIQAFLTEIQETVHAMEVNLQNKYTEYQNNQAQYSDLIKSAKMKEINDLQVRYEEFQQEATDNLKSEQEKLFKPIMDKARKAIEEVAKEQKYTYIFDESAGSVLYGEESNNIMALVKKKLGLK